MSIWELLLIAVGLAMDALAVSVASGIAEPHAPLSRQQMMAGGFGLFQGAMPLIGFFIGSLFAEMVGIAAPWIAFGLLGFIGGKMIFDAVHSAKENTPTRSGSPFGWMNMLMMAVATSIDACMVGLVFAVRHAETVGPLSASNMLAGYGYLLCAAIIAVVTYVISFAGIRIGSHVGDIFGNRASIVGGIVLVLIGLKMLVESFFK